MSDNLAHIDVDSDEFEGTPKALRDHVKKLQRRNDELATERDGFRDQINANALSGVLTGFKNPALVQRDLLAAKVDPLNAEAVTQWVEENGSDYARGETPAPVPTEPSAEEAAHKALNLGGEYRPAADMGKLEVAKSQLPDNPTPEQVAAALQANGI